MTSRDAAVALRRFGLGARPGEARRIAADPRGYVAAQLRLPAAAAVRVSLPTSMSVLADWQVARRERQETARSPTPPAPAAATPPANASGPALPSRPPADPAPERKLPSPAPPPEPRPARILREAFRSELDARVEHGVATDAPFLERLVLFWSNHFSVSASKGVVRGLAGGFEREAIRPHVLGRFADMLLAVVRHPAMLVYLDNDQSIGPRSQVGSRRARGLNENLAREVLELHALGADGGYTQADVSALARLLTGWTVGRIEDAGSTPGTFFFAPGRHEPGGAELLGRRYAQGGVAEGEAALVDIARHPATARHIARKLARHFVADAAPPALLARLETAFREQDGDLAAVAAVLVEAPEAWQPPPVKIVPPYDFLVGLVRGFGSVLPPREVLRLTAALGQPSWTPSSPKGWPDDDDAWTAPAALRERLRIGELVARRIAVGADPRALAADLLAGSLSEATRVAVSQAESREQGFELLIMSPEMLRR